MSYGSECPSHGVYARVTEVKHWIQFIAQGAEDSNCKREIPEQQGNIISYIDVIFKIQNSKLFSGLLITGGESSDGDSQHTAEVWLPSGRSCLLPRLPDPGRSYHTQTSLTACGGSLPLSLRPEETMKSCDTFDGEWEQSHSLIAERKNHVSWQSPAGIRLMGGDSYLEYGKSEKSSELLSTTTNTSTPGFNLTYITE